MHLIAPADHPRRRRFRAMPSFLTTYPVPQWAAILTAGIGTLLLLLLIPA